MTPDQWNARAKYMRSASPETVEKIKKQATFIYSKHPAQGTESALELVIHQQRLVDWMESHPRSKTVKKPKQEPSLFDPQLEEDGEEQPVAVLVLRPREVQARRDSSPDDNTQSQYQRCGGGRRIIRKRLGGS